MQLNLRKANAVQATINSMLKEIKIETIISGSIFKDPESTVNEAYDQLGNNIGRRKLLLDTLYEIRKQVSKANVNNNLDNKLADLARLDADIAFTSLLLRQKPREDINVIKAKIDRSLKANAETSYHLDDIIFNVLTAEDLQGFNALSLQYKKQKQSLQDELLALNLQTMIDISDQAVGVLTSEGIL